MKCPHCTIFFHDSWIEDTFQRHGHNLVPDRINQDLYWYYRTAYCPECQRVIIEVARKRNRNSDPEWEIIVPKGATRGPAPPEVPVDIVRDYLEACDVLPISAKASAALARRCLQAMLRSAGYRAKDLAKEVDLLLNEPDPKKALTHQLRETVDAIRNFGNFSAHPIDDKTTIQVIEVEPHEAEWCLDVIEELFQHFYVGPAKAKAKKDALNAKLTAAGKPLAK
ncbi:MULTISPECIES: DUF4145 domain-containing protein [unclassified Bradyrhizobium]|uniref:DUF4145 domain-containing protein n=1 Tax=unclassified Bradyrhizobium TaxID=2631580 RepID=UPI0028EE8B29|nr:MULTISPECIES: DUF4145 domain-containing protein [unclassified Bradyrhizobium]